VSSKKQEFSWWKFSRSRQCWIDEADRLVADAHDLIGDFEPHTRQHLRDFTRAARMLQKSARLYRNAGLGVMAVASWEEAAQVWASLGDDECCDHCEGQASKIQTYWDDCVNEEGGL